MVLSFWEGEGVEAVDGMDAVSDTVEEVFEGLRTA